MWLCLIISLALPNYSLEISEATAKINEQLLAFKENHDGPIGILTTTSGAPVSQEDADESLNSDLLFNPHLLDELISFNRERIPNRVVHGKAAGAQGYFKVTHDVTNITNALFLSPGKVTPVAARLSVSFSEKGSPDTIRGPHSIAAKFYTEEGNFDFTGFASDTLFLKDPLFAPIHAFFRNPKTHVKDPNALWDWVTLRQESHAMVLQYMGNRGLFQSYRHMPNHAIHTYQVENDNQDISFVRFHLTPDAGVKWMNTTYAQYLAGTEPDYYIKDLYNTIASGDFPSWTFGIQVIPYAEVNDAEFDIFDLTLRWPYDKYPIRPIGSFVLNKNPTNHFREVEQIIFNPGNVVPGIQGVDKMFAARTMAYRDAHIHRLGSNFNNIQINCPLSKSLTYTRDGVAPIGNNMDDVPHYYPNSFFGPVPANVTRTRTKRVKIYTKPEPMNYMQSGDWYRGLDKDSQDELVFNLVASVKQTYPSIQTRALDLFGKIDADLRNAVEQGLAKSKSECKSDQCRTKPERAKPFSSRGRRSS